MAKKKTKKLKLAHPGDTFAMPKEIPSLPRTNVEMKKAKNGYVVSSYHPEKGEQLYISTSHAKAKKHANKLFKFPKIGSM